MTTEEWVRRLNKLASELDEICNMVHPSAWPEMTAKKSEQWKRLAKGEVIDHQHGIPERETLP